MGFTSGLLGGFTLTASLLYLSSELHSCNRSYQAALLRQQSTILDNMHTPRPAMPPPTSRQIQAGLLETAKDKWNSQLEQNVKRVSQIDWSQVGMAMEEAVSRVWRRAFEGARGRSGD